MSLEDELHDVVTAFYDRPWSEIQDTLPAAISKVLEKHWPTRTVRCRFEDNQVVLEFDPPIRERRGIYCF